MNSFKLLAFDLDGTFLTEDKEIPDENLSALKAAIDAGITVVPSTGRLLDNMPEPFIELCRYFILVNGAVVYDAYEDKYLYDAPIPTELALKIYDYGDTLPCIYDAYIDYHGYMTSSMYDVLEDYMPNKKYAHTMKVHRKPVPNLKKYAVECGGEIQKIQFYFKNLTERDRQIEQLPQLFPGELYVSNSLTSNIEINIKDAIKGRALEVLCSHLNIDMADTVAFGDGTNDLSMIERAGIGVCMVNGSPICKKAADIISEVDNDHAGFAVELMRLLNYQQLR